ncbi:MAG: glycosyltransferase family 2 protein [Chloroherpetonaceae bacterium]|nr:glycosyltransferase family 2 protein [Chloroherpetonaceae bacterium]MDW8438225.1 glycosyltransferase family 2 protein [Chloroherpetonaceae bacterium]
MRAKVNVLLSTYNGEKFLSQQLDSLLAQTYPDILIHVRDDGSSDKTLDILDAYRNAHPNIRVTRGENMGAAKSFYQLLLNADDSCEYFAYCDQDDVWKSDKIERAIAFHQKRDPAIPALYFSEFEIVDANLRRIASSKPYARRDFKTALLQNVPFGCAQVWNKAAQRLLATHPPNFFYMHDWWNFLVISGVGEILYDPAETLYYRAHGANVFGQTTSFWARMTNRVALLRRRKELPIFSAWRQAVEFERLFAPYLSPEHRETLAEFTRSKENVWRRLRYAMTGKARRASRLDTLIFKAMVVFNRY